MFLHKGKLDTRAHAEPREDEGRDGGDSSRGKEHQRSPARRQHPSQGVKQGLPHSTQKEAILPKTGT